MKKKIRNLVSSVIVAAIVLSTLAITAFAAPALPDTITKDGRVFTKDEASGGINTAILETPEGMLRSTNGYTLLASDVKMYIDYSHGHGGDQFAVGWVQTNAPSFYARAEIRLDGVIVVTGVNTPNIGDIATSSTPLALGVDDSRKPYVFYGYYYS